ncbi:MAG: M50 family metallopeptidase [Planctomycetota bacterium]|jgi:Zn-dependent protease
MYDKLISSKTIGRIFGIEVKITYILLFFIGIMSLLSLGGGVGAFFQTLIIYAALGLFVFLHEMGHSLAAIKDGARVNAIYLHPLGGIAEISGGLPGPGSEIMVAAAGPFVSLLLSALFYLPMLIFGGSDSHSLLYYFFSINMILALFNFLPIFPLDGGRILTALLVIKMGPDRALPLAVKIARGGIIALGIFGFILFIYGSGFGLNILLIAVFIYFLGNQEMQAMNRIQSFSGGYGTYISQPQKTQGWFSARIDEWKKKKEEKKKAAEAVEKEEVDNILRKVNEEGISSLTPEEKDILNRASDKIRNEK